LKLMDVCFETREGERGIGRGGEEFSFLLSS
jgi:hypothetical protein